MNFAVIDGENVLNIIIAESKAIAEEVTGKVCVEYTTEPAEPGGTYVDGTFIPKKPYPSWVLNGSVWNAPIPYPTTDLGDLTTFIWDESSISWIKEPQI